MFLDPNAPRLRIEVRRRACWWVLRSGTVAPGRVVEDAEYDDLLACLGRCDRVVARRRHDQWHGPIVGVRRDGGIHRITEAIALGEAPMDGDLATTWFCAGMEASLFLLSHHHPEVAVWLPPTLSDLGIRTPSPTWTSDR